MERARVGVIDIDCCGTHLIHGYSLYKPNGLVDENAAHQTAVSAAKSSALVWAHQLTDWRTGYFE